MAKPDRRSLTIRIEGLDKKHIQATTRYARQVGKLYDEAAKEYASLAGTIFEPDPNKPFSFADYPRTQKKAAQIAADLTKNVQRVIEAGQRSEWLAATYRADQFLAGILDRSKLSPAELQQYEDRNMEGLAAFQGRKVQGLSLSDRVWKCTDQFTQHMELALDVAIGEGRSAQELSRDVRNLLNEPNKLFRRVRDKYGNLRLSKAAAAYHPGRGVYRSSYQNAMRLARTEINMAYKTADWERWQRLDFVVGIRIGLSNNHTIKNRKGELEPLTDICDELAGDYPKTFKFVGWHPNCRCVVTPILQRPQEMHEARRARLHAIMNDEAYKAQPSADQVTDVPAAFKAHIEAIADRSKGWKSQPFYIRDNFKGGTIQGGLSPAVPHKSPVGGTTTKPNTPPQPCTEYDAQINQLNIWAYACGLDISRLAPLRASGDKTGLKAEVDRLEKIVKERTAKVDEKAQILRALRAGEASGVPEAIKIIDEALTGYFDKDIYWEDAITELQEAWVMARAVIRKAAVAAKPAAEIPKEITDAPDIDTLTTELVNFDVIANKYSADLTKCTLEQAKIIAGVAYQMKQRYKLQPLSKCNAGKTSRGAVAQANGLGITVSQSLLGKRNKAKITEAYNNSVGNYTNNLRNRIKNTISAIRSLQAQLDAGTIPEANKKYVVASIASYKKQLKTAWDEYRNYSCFTVGRSADTYLENSVIHEFGHIMHDQLLGGINRSLRNTDAFMTATEANQANNEARDLFYKYKNSKDPADHLWLSKYGFSDWQEFIAESHVLYINGDPRLPADVKAWFTKVKTLANKRK